MFKNYLITAYRIIKRQKLYSFINIFGLAIGMACCIVILLLVRHELSFDRFHKKGDRIYRILANISFGDKSMITSQMYGPMGKRLAADYPEVIDYTRFFSTRKFLAHYKDKQLYIDKTQYADASIFNIFDFKLVSGIRETALSEPYTAVLTQNAAEKIFGDEDPIGKVFYRNRQIPYTVTGVLKNIPKNSHLQFDMLLSMTELSARPDHIVNQWRAFNFITYLLLEKDADVKNLERQLPEFAKKYLGDKANRFEYFLQPLYDIHLYSSVSYDTMNWYRSDISYIYGISLLAVIILLLACFNFTNLSAARSAGRAMEVGIRKVQGANRSQLIWQFLGESLLMAFFSMILAIALVEIFLPALNNFFGGVLAFDFLENWTLLLGLAGITVITGVLSGSYPAFIISAFRPISALKGASLSKSGKSILKKTIVVVQFTVSIILLVSVIIITGQLKYIHEKNLGFDKDNVVTIPMSRNSSRQAYEAMRNEIFQHPEITAVARSHRMIGHRDGFSRISYCFEGGSSEDEFGLNYLSVDYDFFSVYDIEFVEGKPFSREYDTDASGGRAYVINRAVMKEMGWNKAVGRKVWQKDEPNTNGSIIGVVKDFHYMSLHNEIKPFIFIIRPGEWRFISVRIKSGNISNTMDILKSVWEKYVPDCPFEYIFLDEHFENLYRSEQRISNIITTSSLLTIFISCLGLLGLISFSVQSRTKEIGIRKVLGASVPGIVFMLSKEFLKWVLIANVIAWPMAYYAMNKWLRNFAYKIDLSWWIFALAGALALFIALMTVNFQAVKAARANPIEALRYE